MLLFSDRHRRTVSLIGVLACALITGGCASVRVSVVDVRLQHAEDRGEQAYQHGDYQGAETYLQQGLLAARQQRDERAEVRFLVGLARVDESLGRFRQSVSRADEAAKIARRLGDRPLETSALNALGLGYRRLADYATALSLAERALEIARRIPDPRLQAESLRNIGAVQQALGDYDKAASRYEASLALAGSIGDPSEEAKSLNNLGGLYRLRGDYPRALDYYERSLANRRKLHDQAGEGRVLGNMCLAYENLGDHALALDYCRQSLGIARKLTDRVREANNLNNIGAIYRALGDYRQALSHYQQSVELKRGFGDRAGVGRGLNNMAEIYWQLGQHDKAVAYFDRSLETKTAIGDRSGESATEVNLGSLYLDRRRYRDALMHFQQALALQAELGQPEVLWRVFDGLSRAQAALQHSDLAIMFGKQGVNAIQSVRANLRDLDEDLQRSFLEDKTRVYRHVADLLVDAGRLPEAQQVLAMLKEEEYFDFIRRESRDDPRATGASYTKSEEEWVSRYRDISRDLVQRGQHYSALKAKKRIGLTAEEQARLDDLDADLRAGRKAFAAYLKASTDAFVKAGGRPAIEFGKKDLDNLTAFRGTLQRLDHGAVLVHYLITEDRLRIIVTGPDPSIPPVHRDDAIDAVALRRLIQQFRDRLTEPGEEPLQEAKGLYRHLIGPIEDDLQAYGTQTLMVYLDGALRYLPLAALHDGKRYLAERYAVVTYTVAAKDKLLLPPAPNWRVAGLGVSQAVDRFPALSAVPDELDGIVKTGESDPKGVLPGEEHLDAAFTAAELQAVLGKGYPVIHLASHFKFEPGTDEDSFLVMGGGAHLSLAELKEGDYPLGGVELLTLSACETAVGSTDADGREVEGLGALAQSQGANAVLATLWPVADRSTAQFMEQFYAQRTGHRLTKAEALRETQLRFLRGSQAAPAHAEDGATDRGVVISGQPQGSSRASERPYAHPYYWAPFILMGNWL